MRRTAVLVTSFVVLGVALAGALTLRPVETADAKPSRAARTLVINKSGRVELKRDLVGKATSDAPAIRIDVSDVVLDLGAHALFWDTSDMQLDSVAVFLADGVQNVTITNGRIVGGQHAVAGTGNANVTLSGLTLEGQTGDSVWLSHLDRRFTAQRVRSVGPGGCGFHLLQIGGTQSPGAKPRDVRAAVVFEDVVVIGAAENGYRLESADAHTDLVFDGACAQGSDLEGFFIAGGDRVRMRRCLAEDGAMGGIFASGVENLVADDLRVVNNAGDGVAFEFPVYVELRSSCISGNARHGLLVTVDGGTSPVRGRLVDNEIIDSGHSGVVFAGSGGATVGLRPFVGEVSGNSILGVGLDSDVAAPVAYDGDVVYHEMGHWVRNRLEGGGRAGSTGLEATFRGGLVEANFMSGFSNGAAMTGRHVQFVQNVVTDNSGTGVRLSGLGNALRGNNVSENGTGLDLSAALGTRVDGNQVAGNTGTGVIGGGVNNVLLQNSVLANGTNTDGGGTLATGNVIQ